MTYKDGTTATATGYFPGGSKGALHFYTPSGVVVSAYCDWTGTGTPGNMNLNISHFTPDTTTTVSAETTVPTTESTTTTESSTTTTEPTTVTTAATTSTTQATTSTTQATTTSTTPTTEAGETTVPSPSSTSSTESATTSSAPPVTGGETTTPAASQVQAGGGGTAGMGGGLWALIALAASLGLGLTASTLRTRLSAHKK